MLSPAWPAEETQTSTLGVTHQSQTEDSPVAGPAAGSSTSATTSSMLDSHVGGQSTNAVTPVTTTLDPSMDSGSSTSIVVPATPAASSPRPIPGTSNDPLQDPVRAKFVTSPGYVVPAPSFSYSVFPRMNSVSGVTQQSSSTPALRLTPQMPAAALQPPVPGRSLANRPSFSYNVVPHANANPASGQQFQPATAIIQSQLQGVRFAPPTAASLQPPVPRQPVHPSSSISGMVTHNYPPPVQLPLPTSKGQLSSSSNFSFVGSSQPASAETSEKNSSSNTVAADAATPEIGTDSATSVARSIKLSTNVPTGSSVATVASPIQSSSGILMPTTPSFPVHPRMPASSGTPGIPLLSNTAINRPTAAESSPASRAMMPSPASAPSTSSTPTALQNVQQQVYPSYPSVPAMGPPAHWLYPPQAGGVQRAPFLPYPGVLPAPFPLPMNSVPLSSVPLSNVQPPGVSTVVVNEGIVSSTTESSHSGSNLQAGSSLPIVDHDKQVDGGVSKTGVGDAWTVHKTEAGVIYYYNSITGESTYNKPSDFKGEVDKATAQTASASCERLTGTDWTVVTTNDGKKYYYDTKNKVSSWQIPAEVAEMQKNQDTSTLKGNASHEENASPAAEKGSAPVSLSIPAVHTGGRDSVALRTPGAQVSSSALDLIKKKLQDAGTPVSSSPLPAATPPAASDPNGSKAVEAAAKGQPNMNGKEKVKDANGDGNISDSSSDSDDGESGPTKEELVVQFKEMLKERGVAPFSKWDKELPKIVFDPRFKAVQGYSARRSIFEHYVRTRAEEERKEKRAAQKAAVDGFKQLLEEASEDIDHRTDYQACKKKWGSDPRFEALDRKERELLLNEKILPLKKAAEEKIQAVRMSVATSFKSMLRENGDITTSSRWSKVKDNLRNDPRYKIVKHEDREVLFNEYISELKAAEDEVERAAKCKRVEHDKLKEREREMRKRKEREEQEMERIRLKVRRKEAVSSYQALLVETIKDPKASWTESKPKLQKDPQHRATNPDLSEADMERLFRDHVKDLYERSALDFRSLLAEVITADAANQVTGDAKSILSSWSEAKRLLKPDPRYSKMPRKERESLWCRHAEDLMRKLKAAADPKPKEKQDREGRNRTSSADLAKRSPRPHSRR